MGKNSSTSRHSEDDRRRHRHWAIYTDPKYIQKVKLAYLDAYDVVVGAGGSPTLRNVVRVIPFFVCEKFAAHIRQELEESGDLPPVTVGRTRSAIDPNFMGRGNSLAKVPPGEIARRAAEVRVECALRDGAREDDSHVRQAEHAARAAAQRSGEEVPSWDPSPAGPTPRDVAAWAVRRYGRAWRKVRGIAEGSPPAPEPTPEPTPEPAPAPKSTSFVATLFDFLREDWVECLEENSL